MKSIKKTLSIEKIGQGSRPVCVLTIPLAIKIIILMKLMHSNIKNSPMLLEVMHSNS